MSVERTPLPPADAKGDLDKSTGRFWHNTRFSVLQQVASMLLAIFLLPYLISRLGLEKYGLWAMLQVFNIFGLISLAELGFHGAIVRQLVHHHVNGEIKQFRALLSTGFVLFTGIGLIVTAGVAAFAQTWFTQVFAIPPAYAAEMEQALLVYSIGLAVGFPVLILKAFYAGRQDVATQKLWELTDRILFTLGMVVLLFFTDNLVHMAALEVALGFVLAAGMILHASISARQWFTLNPRVAAFNCLRGVGRLSGAVFATGLSNQIYFKAPEALIGAILGPIALAQFQIATRLPRVFKSLQGALNAAVLPHVSGLEASSEDRGEARRRFFVHGLRLNFLLFVPATVGAIVFAPFVLTLWVGQEYAWLSGYLALYAVWQLISVVIGFSTATLTQAKHYQALVWRNIGINVIFVIALLWGLENSGLSSVFFSLLFAGVASGASALSAAHLANGFAYRDLIRSTVIPIVVLGGGAGFALLLPARLVLGEHGLLPGLAAVVAGGVIYVVFLAVTVLSPEERRNFGEVLAKRASGK